MTTAQKHGLSTEVDELFQKVEKDQSIQVWDSFLPTPFIKKNLGSSFRLVCSKHPLENKGTIVISFLACFPRGGSGEYEKFISNPDQVCGKYLPDKEILLNYIESRKDEELPPPPPEPTEAEREYLYDALEQSENSDIMVYESMDWVESMKNTNMLEMSTRLYDLLVDLLGNIKEIGDLTIKDDNKSVVSIFYKFIPAYRSIFLVAPFFKKDRELAVTLNRKYQCITEQIVTSEDIILKQSRRSYPSYILADEQMWKSIQKNDVGNIALSPEESQILEEVSIKSSDKLFPLFINGRPGSGKSTILQYLFASYLVMYLRKDNKSRLPYPPLYLTYSEKLLDSAKKNIDDILKCNSIIALHGIALNSESALEVREKCYGIFHQFLLELLPPEKRQRFSLDHKIHFPIFRNFWDERRKRDPLSEIRKLSPELTWHVIRSYIKGMHYDVESDFSVESYYDLPKNQQTVQIETFKLVYEHVWHGWYKPFCEENDYWDDQDLVFAVLNEPLIDLSRYPAIFCDEAQDFSKLELDLILRLSLYSQRTISPYELKRVPFAFAGDPFQTLNPTGFEWESLQANFHEKIVSGLDKSSIGKLEFNYQELSYNYRSGKFIVGLCNLLQLLRGLLFDQKDLKPQQNWFDTDSSMPVFFNVKDPLCEQKLRDQTELVIILPCQEGEEEEYVKDDDFLRGLATSEVDIRNFLSPMRAKGLEFSRVVLYKFGSACYQQYPNLFKPLMTGESHSENKDASLPLKYFMNRLYVGASRAKNRLIIVDDDKGIETLWNNDAIKSLENLLRLYQHSSKFGWTIDTINYVQKGIEDNWTEDRDDPFLLAEDFHNAGLTERDPYKLRLAEANYMRCGQPANAKLSKAERLEMEKQLSKAGELYLELDRTDKALECYWLAEDFTAIAKNSKFSNTPEQRAASFHLGLGERNVIESQHFLDFLLEQVKGPSRLKISWDPRWKKILDECLYSILKNLKKDDSRRLYSLIKGLDKEGFSPSDKWKYAELAYLAEEYKHAVILWESSDSSPEGIHNYNLAKAHESPYPSNLICLEAIKDYARIIEQYKTNQKEVLDNKSTAIVLEALLAHEDYENAVVLLKAHPEEECLSKSYTVVKKKSLQSYQEIIGQLLIKKLVDKEKWKDLVDLFKDKNLPQAILHTFSGILAYEIAQSKEFRQTTFENKNAMAIILKKLFIDSPWEDIVSMRVAGAAIESAYKIIDALEFYEGVWKKERIPAEKIDVDYAIARWVKSKLRLAEVLEKEKNLLEAGKHRAEAEKICRSRLGINKDNIPDDPQFDVNETWIMPTSSKNRASNVSRKTRDAIIALHKLGWMPHAIAESFSLEPDIVELIIEEMNKRAK